MTKAASTTYPPGIPYIIGNEAAERFSYYGMKTILVVFMTQYLLDPSGKAAPMSDAEAKSWYHLFSAANYFFPVIGALISDIFWGKYKTIIRLSLLYCLGHLALAVFETRMGLAVGLTCIAIGSGGIKPCVSAHVGDQFSARNKHLVEKIFSWFYFSINLGALASTLLTPYLLNRYGPSIAFGVPGILMFVATFIFWLGRKRFIAVPPSGWENFKSQLITREGRESITQLCILYLFISMFWALFDQTGSSWVLQAKQMDRFVWLPLFGSVEILPSQLQALNPVLVMILIPVFAYFIYPIARRHISVSPLQRIFIGMFFASISFIIVGYAQWRLDSGVHVTIVWQMAGYLVLTASEVMVSITALEFSYTQAPNLLKSLVMGLFFLSVSLGNVLASGINAVSLFIGEVWWLQGAWYFFTFAMLMAFTAVLFGLYSRSYKMTEYFQR